MSALSERAVAKVIQFMTMAAVLRLAGPVRALTEPDCQVMKGIYSVHRHFNYDCALTTL